MFSAAHLLHVVNSQTLWNFIVFISQQWETLALKYQNQGLFTSGLDFVGLLSWLIVKH